MSPTDASVATAPQDAAALAGRAASARLPLVGMHGLSRVFDSPTGPVVALDQIDLEVARGEFLVIVGPSGSGKTTLLRILAQLDRATTGTIAYPLTNDGPPANAMVFQGRSVFPWRTVRDNVTYGLQLRGTSRHQRRETADRLLDLVGLRPFAGLYPHQLSEGMRQRVAIARALAVDPELLLMDEPFGALDEQTRYILQDELLRIWEQTHKTVVFITHSIDEALTMADRIIVLSSHPGRIIADIRVPFARPRELSAVRSDPAFSALFSQIWDLLKGEVQRARALAGETT